MRGTLLCLSLLFCVTANAQLFSQRFPVAFSAIDSAYTGIDYVAATPNNNQFTYLGSSGNGFTVQASDSGNLLLSRTGTTVGGFCRNASFSTATSLLYIQFDVEVMNASSAQQNALSFQVGSGFSNNALEEPTTKVHSRIGISFGAQPGSFLLTNMTGNVNSSQTFTGKQRITLVINRTGATVNYYTRYGTLQNVANGRMDVYAGGVLAFNDMAVTTATVALNNFKLSFARGTGDVAVSELLIDVIPATPVAKTAANFSSTGFTARWNTIASADSYILEVATNNTFTAFVSGYNKVVTSADSINVTGLNPATNYFYRVRGVKKYAIDSITGNNSAVITATTLAASPNVSAVATATAIGSNGATLTGTIISANGSAILQRGFVISKTVNNANPVLGGDSVRNIVVTGTTTGAFSLAVTGLDTATNYVLRSYATNALGTSYSSVQNFTTLSLEPAAYPSNMVFTNLAIDGYKLTWRWTAASPRPTGFLIVRRTLPGNAFSTWVPVDGVTYTSGMNVGDATVLYVGNDTTININGLQAGAGYGITIYPFNGDGITTNYRTTTTGISRLVRYTLSLPPVGHAADFSVSSYNSTTVTFNISSANSITNAKGYLILRRTGNFAPLSRPIDATWYAAGNTIGDGIVAAVVTNSNQTTVTATGLLANTTYTFLLIPFDSVAASTQTLHYYTDGNIPSITTSTLFAEPSTSSVISFSNIGTDALTVNWTASTGATGYLLLRTINAGNIVPNTPPVDFIDYTVGDTLGNAVVKYVGSLRTFRDSLLNLETQYTYAVYPYNVNSSILNYRITSPGTGSRYTSGLKPIGHADTLFRIDFNQSFVRLGFSPASTLAHAKGYLVLRTAGTALPNTLPSDGINYSSGATLGNSTVAAVIYSDTTSAFTFSGLTGNTTYRFSFIPLDTAGVSLQTVSYNTSATIRSLVTNTLISEPTTSPLLSFTNVTDSSMTVNWTAATGATGYILAQAIDTGNVSPSQLPIDNINYTVGDTLGNYVIRYIGALRTFNIFQLSELTRYSFMVIPYAANTTGINYRITAPAVQSQFTNSGVKPTQHASLFNVKDSSTNSISLVFSPASSIPNAKGYLILYRAATATTDLPIDGSAYTVNQAIGNSRVGAVVNSASDTTVVVTGLTDNTTYFFRIFPFNSDSINPLTTIYYTNPIIPSVKSSTLPTSPAAQPSALVFSQVTATSMRLSWTASTIAPVATGYIVLRSASPDSQYPDSLPQQAVTYTAGTILGDAVVVYNGNALNTTVTGLQSNATYYYRIYAYRNSGAALRYNLVNPLQGLKKTSAATPTAQPSQLIFTNTVNSLSLSWNSAIPNSTGYILLRTTASGTAYPNTLPANGSVYNVGNVLGNATIVYIGSDTTFTNNGLAAGSRYNYTLLSYNGDISDSSAAFLTTGVVQGFGFTLAAKPAAHAAYFSLYESTDSSASFLFNEASTIANAAGYLLLMQKGDSAINSLPVNANAYNVGDSIGNAVVASVLPTTANSVVISGLMPLTPYQFSLIPFNRVASVNTTHHYRTDAVIPSLTVLTQSSVTLPLVFVSANCFIQNKKAIIRFNINSATPVASFVIEKSVNGFTWNSVGEVNSIPHQTQYTYLDDNIIQQTTYYRIKAMLKDGNSLLSAVMTLKQDSDKPDILVFPNPAREIVNVSLKYFPLGKYHISLIDMYGQIIMQENLNVQSPYEQLSINVSRYAKGNYIIIIQNEANRYSLPVSIKP